MLRKLASRQKDRVLDATLDDQFASGRLLACIVAGRARAAAPTATSSRAASSPFYKKKLDVKKDKATAVSVSSGGMAVFSLTLLLVWRWRVRAAPHAVAAAAMAHGRPRCPPRAAGPAGGASSASGAGAHVFPTRFVGGRATARHAKMRPAPPASFGGWRRAQVRGYARPRYAA